MRFKSNADGVRVWAVGLLLACVVSIQGATYPFILPWNDATPGITDFSKLNPAIGTSRVIVNAEGHFAIDGARIRLLGVNFAGDSPFMPTNKAEGVAARLAKFGINNVRFHHMDAPWAYNGGILSYTGASSTNFNPSQLERLHYCISRLKTHGIYANVNLLVGREYRSWDGLGPEVTTMDWKDAHVLGLFYEPALRLHKDFATKLLQPINRFTGLSLAHDPAVAFVEIINENGILQKWLEGSLDRFPQRYATNLQARWNRWLSARYTSQDALLQAWGIIDEALGPNLLRNGAFSNGLASWYPEQHDVAKVSASRTYDFSNAPSARLQVTTPSPTSWHVQFNQPDLSLVSNQVYTISFWAKASTPTNIEVSVMRAHTDWAGLGYSQTIQLTTNWQRYSGTYQAPVTEANARLNFGSLGNKRATFWFADVRFQPGGQLGTLPEGASLANANLPSVRYSGSGFTGTTAARRDWIRFLRDLENDYYDAMVTHLRDTLGYEGLIFGTIMANSPATVQSRLDVIDGHAYWQHPQFPNRPWDSADWYVPNLSMVNTLDSENTLAGLARQRIKGKPFTVTEYQHPSPNYYGAEGPLLLAAYGALQDWDGLWMFDYGHGNDTVGMGFVRGFFEIGQHPAKMANMLLAANLFRRGDIQPARHEFTMKLMPDREVDLVRNTSPWSLFNAGQLGMPGRLAFTSRLSTSVGENSIGLETPPTAPVGNNLSSDTGELRWNLTQPGKGLVTANTARTKILLGAADETEVSLGEVSLRPGKTLLGWCSLGLTLTRGESFTNECSALIVATGWWENTGQAWNEKKDSVGTQWGRAPVLTEVVPFTLTLPVATNRVRVWALDERGQRKAIVPVAGDSHRSTITPSSAAATLWYELEVAPTASASYRDWIRQYFSSLELDEPLVSGPIATPDGDHVPNILKYYLGLPGRTAAAGEALPLLGFLQESNSHYLALTLERPKTETSLMAEALTTSDLSNWNSATSARKTVVDLGPTERHVFFDTVPITDAEQRYLRLVLRDK